MRFKHIPGWTRCAYWLGGVLLIALVGNVGVAAAWAAPSALTLPGRDRPLRVATRIVPPLVMQKQDALTGFSIELWQAITDQLGVKSDLLVKEDVGDILTSVAAGQADLGIAAISITTQRYQKFDFSQPILEGGLQILVREPSRRSPSLTSIPGAIFSRTMLQILGISVVMVLVPAHLIWFFERHHRKGMIPDSSYFPGIFKACWWAASTLATQADEMPKSPAGRVIATLSMFASVVFVAYFTATVTTSLTVQQLRSNIRGPEDLPGKRVATIANSTSATYLRERRIDLIEFSQIEAAYVALQTDRVDAVVFDSPVLLYYAAHDGQGKVAIVGGVFRKEDYGIVFPPGSPYIKPINAALLTLRENGKYQEIYDRWFGDRQ